MSELSIIMTASGNNPDISQIFFQKCGKQQGSAVCSMDDAFLAGFVMTVAVCCAEGTEVQKLTI